MKIKSKKGDLKEIQTPYYYVIESEGAIHYGKIEEDKITIASDLGAGIFSLTQVESKVMNSNNFEDLEEFKSTEEIFNTAYETASNFTNNNIQL